MKTLVAFVSFSLLLLIPVSVHAQSVPTFTPVSSSPVLTKTESWERDGIYAFTVIFDSGLYKMWYAAGIYNQQYNAPLAKIGYATSTDGMTWTKNAANPILSASFTKDVNGHLFNGVALSYPSVVKVGSTYFMYYRETDAHGTYMIGWATSSDGISWSKGNTPVLSGTFPNVVYVNGVWKMWYSIDYGTSGKIGYATSSDGTTWTLVDQAAIPRPPQYDYVDHTDTVLAGGTYHMWYGVSSQSASGKVLYATSSDGITWSGFSDSPLPAVSSDVPVSVVVGETSYMWFLLDDGIHLASTTMAIPEFEPVLITPLLITGLALICFLTLATRRNVNSQPNGQSTTEQNDSCRGRNFKSISSQY